MFESHLTSPCPQPFVAPLLRGSFSHALFQIAAVCVYADQHQIPCYVGYVTHDKSSELQYRPFAGHAMYKGESLQDIFPNLNSITTDSSYVVPASDITFLTDQAFVKLYTPLHNVFNFKKTPFISGWFLNFHCL